MEKEFVPYNEALELKEIGFDEPSFGYYNHIGNLFFNTNSQPVGKDWVWKGNELLPTDMVLAPTFSQAFRWFREKYVLFHSIIYLDDNSGDGEFSFEILNKKGNQQQNGEYFEYNSYEEAELACLKKLIEIVKSK